MDLKILKIKNLIPVKIDYTVDGKELSTYAYIDYVTQTVSGAEEVSQELSAEFQKTVKSFLSQPRLELDVPLEVYQQHEKGSTFNMNDYITDDLSVQLKKR
jgi:hypothetical protein